MTSFIKSFKTRLFLSLLMFLTTWCAAARTAAVYRSETASARIIYGVEKMKQTMEEAGFELLVSTVTPKELTKLLNSRRQVVLVAEASDPVMVNYLKKRKIHITDLQEKESYNLYSDDCNLILRGFDASGALYACMDVCDRIRQNRQFPTGLNVVDQPDMVLRGACIGMQKMTYLPGRTVYEYPYTPENFPWFYDKVQWVKYLDMLVENRLNSLYLWNGHPFASLVRLADYPFAVEVNDEDFARNEAIYRFLTEEADKRGIWVIQMFYNIIVSKSFAEHYGMSTQDRNRPITPLIADYTRKSIAAFIQKYPNVGLLVCLGEAINTYEDDVEWFTKTILPGVQDGLKALGKTEEVPVILRAHDTNCKMVMDAALPLYKNLYTMNKYNGESLVTYEPGGPWAKVHKDLSALGSTHISNVHILANLEPFRWSSPEFIQRSVQAMHNIHGANALHLYPQASYWDWPYTADNTPVRLLQIDRDWMWYKAWARYAWKDTRGREEEIDYWTKQLDRQYGCGFQARRLLEAYEEMGEVSPMLTRKFAITEGNRQTFLLGSFMSQLVNPDRWRVYPDFPNSCDPGGERLAEWVKKEFNGETHAENNPMNVIREAVAHADASVKAIEQVTTVLKNQEEFNRLKNDILCMNAFAHCLSDKVEAATWVMRYDLSDDLSDLDKALPFLESSLDYYRHLVRLTKDSYLYANSMQTRQRRVPVGGDDGKNKTWAELLPLYQDELLHFEKNIGKLKEAKAGRVEQPVVEPLMPVNVLLSDTSLKLVTLDESPAMFKDKQSRIIRYAEELARLEGLRFAFNEQRNNPTVIRFQCDKPVTVLVGYFSTVHTDYLFVPRLETDASANDFGQAETRLANALEISGQPPVNIHTYTFPPGDNCLCLSKGVVLVLGFVDGTKLFPVRDAGLGEKTNIDWLFSSSTNFLFKDRCNAACRLSSAWVPGTGILVS